MTLRPTTHHDEKPSETLVRFIVEHALGVRVCCFDHRRGVSRVDAIIHRHGGAPLEIVSDPLASGNELTGALNRIGRRAKFDGLKHGYKVCLTVNARVNDLGWVEPTLRLLEDHENGDYVPRQTDEYLSIVRFPFLSAGEVLFTTGAGGGRSIPNPPDVVAAASAILARKGYADVSRKLGAHGGVERHAAVIVDEDKNPTFSWLREGKPEDLERFPAPALAEEITHFWITPRYPQGLTMLWSPRDGWRGARWRWGDPIDALESWEDPVCAATHGPAPAASRP